MISCRARLREFCVRKIRRFFQRVRSFFGSFVFFVKFFLCLRRVYSTWKVALQMIPLAMACTAFFRLEVETAVGGACRDRELLVTEVAEVKHFDR